MGEVVEGVAVGVVGELCVWCREPLQALQRYLRKVPTEIGVLRQYHRPTRHEAVYQRLLPHPKTETNSDYYYRYSAKEKNFGLVWFMVWLINVDCAQEFWGRRKQKRVWFFDVFIISCDFLLLQRKCHGIFRDFWFEKNIAFFFGKKKKYSSRTGSEKEESVSRALPF